jgi:hypothetical protein
LQVLERFTKGSKFEAKVTVPNNSLPSDLSYGISAPATDMTLYWETFEEASQENGAPCPDHVAAIIATVSHFKL